MAIRRITDLPVLSAVETGLDRSSFEVSYQELDEEGNNTGHYVSRRVLGSDLMKAVPVPNEFVSATTFLSGINVSSYISLTGNMSANVKIHNYSDYSAKLRFGDFSISALSVGIKASDLIGLTGGNGELAISSDGANGVVSIKNFATVEHTVSANEKSVVNMEQLQTSLFELSCRLLEQISKEDVEVRINFPLLSFVFMDRELTQTESAEWGKAGETIDLSGYDTLRKFVKDNESRLRMKTNGQTPPADDTWYYELTDNSTRLKLPNTNWFVQGGAGDSVTFEKARFPKHCHQYYKTSQKTGFGFSSGGPFAYSNAVASTTTAGTCDLNAMQPNATKMYIYFYLGPKNKA